MALSDYDELVTGSHTTVSDLSSAVNLSTTKPEGADYIQIVAFTKNVMYTIDGTTPTSSTGFPLTAGTIYNLKVGQGATMKVIEAEASASIQYQWFQRITDKNA